MRRSLGLLLLLCPLACATVSPCPARGGPPWHSLVTNHFTLSTDLGVERASEVVTTLETLREAVLAGVFPGANRRPQGHIPVIVVADGVDWHEYIESIDGAFTQRLWQPLIVMRASHRIEGDEVVKHELVHYLSHFYVPVQPRWLAEGVATYFETISYDVDASKVSFGQPSSGRLGWVRRQHMLPLAAVLNDEDEGWSDHIFEFESTSWLLVHFLLNHRSSAFQEYQRHLRSETRTEAWRLAFGDAEALTALVGDVESYASTGKYVVATTPFNPPVVHPRISEVSDAEVHVLRALLYHVGDQVAPSASSQHRALENTDEALRQDPTNPAALLVRQALLNAPVAESAARAAVAARGEDWRAWMALALALQKTAPAESRSARNHAVYLADDPTVALDGE
jgi:hypothetical protein